MRSLLPVFLPVLLAVTPLKAGSPEPGAGKAKAVAGLETDWGGPILGAGLMTNDSFTEGALFSVVPFLNTIGKDGDMEGSVFFIEPYGTWAEEGELGASLGFGFRHLFSDQSTADALSNRAAGLLTEGIFVGANVFVDYAESPYDSGFWQTGAGIEIGTRYLEFRSNYYRPWGDDRVIGSRTESSRRKTTSSSTRSSTGAPSTTAVPGAAGTTFTTSRPTRTTRQSTTRTTTSATSFEYFEEALEGFDLEMALLLPVIDEFCEVKVIGGYYAYSGDRLSSDIDGWRVGVEARPVPAVVLHATWFESDRLYKENWLAGVRVEIPLDGGAKAAFAPRRRHLAERLFEPVRRKNTAITTGTEEQETGHTTRSTTSTSQSGSSSTESTTQFVPNPPPPSEEMPR